MKESVFACLLGLFMKVYVLTFGGFSCLRGYVSSLFWEKGGGARQAYTAWRTALRSVEDRPALIGGTALPARALEECTG